MAALERGNGDLSNVPFIYGAEATPSISCQGWQSEVALAFTVWRCMCTVVGGCKCESICCCNRQFPGKYQWWAVSRHSTLHYYTLLHNNTLPTLFHSIQLLLIVPWWRFCSYRRIVREGIIKTIKRLMIKGKINWIVASTCPATITLHWRIHPLPFVCHHLGLEEQSDAAERIPNVIKQSSSIFG